MAVGDWDFPSDFGGWDVVIPTDDVSITRRRRALAPIQVLTDIERTKASLDGDFWQRYDLFTIALAVIDQVALAMGISAGRTWDQTIEYAAGQAARQVPEASMEEWTRVAWTTRPAWSRRTSSSRFFASAATAMTSCTAT